MNVQTPVLPSRAIDPRTERYRTLLSQTSLFGSVDAAALDDLASCVEVCSRPAGTTLLAQHESDHCVFVLVTGRAKMVLLGDAGRELQLRLLGSGDVFGETVAFGRQPSLFAVVALENVTMLSLDREAVRRHVQKNPETALNLLTHLCERLRAADEIMANLALFDVEIRLARTLTRLASDSIVTDEGITLHARPTQQELANMVGSCRETVSRSYSSLVRRNLLVPRGRALLLTTALLQKIGRASPPPE